jgi:ribosomal-protein-alanine N-acetyltransferase
MSAQESYSGLQVSFTPFPLLRTSRLVLRRIEPGDVEEMLFLRSDPTIMQFLDREPLHTTGEAALFIRHITDALERDEGITWGIALAGNPRLIGTIGFWRLMKEHYRAEIGYLLHPGYWGQGLVSEAMTAVMNYGFDVMKLHSVEANVNPDNKASVRILEKAGFVQEAHFRENYFFQGKFLDSLIFSKLAPKE